MGNDLANHHPTTSAARTPANRVRRLHHQPAPIRVSASVLVMVLAMVLGHGACSSVDYEDDELWSSPPPKPEPPKAPEPPPEPPPPPPPQPTWKLPPSKLPKGQRWNLGWRFGELEPVFQLLVSHVHDSVPPDAGPRVTLICKVEAPPVGDGLFNFSTPPDIRVDLKSSSFHMSRGAFEFNKNQSEVLFHDFPLVEGEALTADVSDVDGHSADDLIGTVTGKATRLAPIKLRQEKGDSLWIDCRFVSPGGLEQAIALVHRPYREAVEHYRRFVPHDGFRGRREGFKSLEETIAAAEEGWWRTRPVPAERNLAWLANSGWARNLLNEHDNLLKPFWDIASPYLITEPGWVEITPGVWMRLAITRACTTPASTTMLRDDWMCMLDFHLIDFGAKSTSYWCEELSWRRGKRTERLRDRFHVDTSASTSGKRTEIGRLEYPYFGGKLFPTTGSAQLVCSRGRTLTLPIVVH